MRLLRTKHWGRYLALLAMVLQFAFVFGHIHGAHLHVDGGMISAARSLLAEASSSHSEPLQENDQDHENCPTCWTLSAAGFLVLADITAITWQFRHIHKHRKLTNSAIISTLLVLPYQVRAPPVAKNL